MKTNMQIVIRVVLQMAKNYYGPFLVFYKSDGQHWWCKVWWRNFTRLFIILDMHCLWYLWQISRLGVNQRNAANVTMHAYRHSKIQTGEKPYKCSQCDFTSSDRRNLRTHLKIHSGEMSNKCNLCHYAIYTASNLKMHLEIHNGE